MSGFDCGSDGSREEEAGCAVLSSGEWNIAAPIVLRWNVAGRPGCLGVCGRVRVENCGGCRNKVLEGWYSRKSDVKMVPGFAEGVDEGGVVVRG